MFLDHLDITDRFDVVRRSSLHGVHGLQVNTPPNNHRIAHTAESADDIMILSVQYIGSKYTL